MNILLSHCEGVREVTGATMADSNIDADHDMMAHVMQDKLCIPFFV